MADRIFVYEEVDRAEASAADRIQAHITPGEAVNHLLTDVATFVKGPDYAGTEVMPLLAMIAAIARPASARGSSAFGVPWEIQLRFRAVVDADDPEVGRPVARSLAGRAMHALTTDPETGEMTWSLPDPEGTGIAYRLDFGVFELIAGPGRATNLLEARSTMLVKFESSY